MVKYAILVFLLVYAGTFQAKADTAQRIGAERIGTNHTSLGMDIGITSFRPASVSILGITPALFVQHTVTNRYFAGLVLPGYIEASITESIGSPVVAAFSDPNMFCGILLKKNVFRYRLQLGYIYPLGIWNEYHARVARIQSGTGYHVIVFEASISSIRDPSVLNATVTYRIGLPRKEQYGSTIKPADIVLSLSLLEILNGSVGVSAVLNHTIEFPAIDYGHIQWHEFRYDLSVNVAVVVFLESSSYTLKVAKNIGDRSLPAAMEIGGLYEIDW
jgi:hypothetical protein